MTAKKPMQHGTLNAYQTKGCRCEGCRAANAARVAADRKKNYDVRRAVAREGERRRRNQPMPASVRHGSLTAFKMYGCRCDLCRPVGVAHRAEEYLRNRSTYVASGRRRRAIQSNAQAAVRRSAQWRIDNPDRFRAQMAAHSAKRRSTDDTDIRIVSHYDWLRLCARYSNCCAYCCQPKPLTQDHIIPLTRGGRHSIGNLLPACRACNTSKKDQLLVEWRVKKRRSVQ